MEIKIVVVPVSWGINPLQSAKRNLDTLEQVDMT